MVIRLIYFYMALFCFFLLGASAVLQWKFHWEPCPLCIIDRGIVIILAALFTIAALYNPNRQGQKICNGATLIFSLIGIGVSSWHLWLLYSPNEMMGCTPSFDYLIQSFPLGDALKTLFQGPECAKDKSALFYIPLSGWALLGFIITAVGSFYGFRADKKKG